MHNRLADWVTGHRAAALVVVLLCSASTRLILAAQTDPSALLQSYPDASTYLTPAHSLIDQRAFLDEHGEPMFHRTPGYPAFLAALIATVGPDLRMVLMAQA